MQFKTYLNDTASKIDAQLEVYYQDWLKSADRTNQKLVPLVKICIEANKGGKRLRGTLVDLGFRLSGADYRQEIIKPAAAFEIFQTAILTHDDIIDQSPLRRDIPTVYHKLGANHYGISQAICLGDVGLFEALTPILEADFSDQVKIAALKSFKQSAVQTVLGEMLDVELSTRRDQATESDALKMFQLKTARYTTVGPLHLGAILGGADQQLLEKLKDFGQSLGIGFQIQDDILGVFSDAQTIGKSVKSDIEEGKVTTLLVKALKQANSEQRKVLTEQYGSGPITDQQLEQIRQIFVQTGALDYSRQLAVQYVDQAKKVIPDLTQDPQMVTLLTQMADFLVKRQK